MFIDTHCHINAIVKPYDDLARRRLINPAEIAAAGIIVEQARVAGVATIVNVGTSLIESLDSIALAKAYQNVFATIGIHPCDATPDWQDDFKQLAKLAPRAEEEKIVGVGEVGLDFYHKPFDAQRQKDCFKAHIELAIEHDLALSIHVRDAGDELLRVLDEYKREIKRAVIHCFCQPRDFADEVISWGFFLGIDAPITYPKNEELRNIVASVPLENLVIETDAPFLPPQSLRGKPNSPAYIPLFASLIAELRCMHVEEVAAITTANAKRLFRLPG